MEEILNIKFEEYLKTNNLALSTIDRYLREINIMSKHIGIIPVESELSHYYYDIIKPNYSLGYLSTTRAALVNYFDFLVQEKFHVVNIAKYLEWYSARTPLDMSSILTSKELDSLLDEREERYSIIKWRNKLIISLVRNYGLSNQDLKNLCINNFNNEKLVIKHPKLAVRKFNIKPIEKYFLDNYIKDRDSIIKENNHDYLFLNKIGSRISNDGISYVIETLKDKSEKVINLHTIRKSVIVEHYMSYNDSESTMIFAGHKSISTTNEVLDIQTFKLKEKRNPIGHWTYQNCQLDSMNYPNRSQFQKNSRSAYDKSLENNWLDEFFTK